MPTPPRTPSRLARAALASLAAVAAVLCWSTPVAAAPKPAPSPAGPQLSIAVDNGLDTAASGDELSYVITLTNVGTEDLSDLLVTQSLPPGTSLVRADAEGDEKTGLVQWEVDLRATKKVTFKTSLKLADTPAEVLRLASVACAKVSVKAPPVVCAADSDMLPAGEAAAEAAATAQTTKTGAPSRTVWYVSAGAVLAAGLATLLVLRLRRRA